MATTELKQAGLVLEESSAPTAEEGTGVLYVKSDGKLYFASDGGSGGDISETQINNQGGSSATVSASTGVYTPQLGVNGDDDLWAFAVNTASLNGDLAIAGGGRILMADNDGDALIIGQGTNDYITFNSTNSQENIQVHKELYMKDSDLTFKHGQKISFWGENESAASGTITVSASSHIVISGSQNKGVIVTGSVSSSVGFYAPQIGVSGDDDLLALASGLVTVNGAVSASGFYASQIGVNGDDDLLTLASSVLGVAGAVSASGFYVQSGGQLGVAGDDDLLSLKSGHFHVSGNLMGAAMSGTTLTSTAISASLGLYTPQIGVSGDDDLLALSSGLVTVNGVVSSSGFYASQIGLSGDDDLMGLSSGELTVNGGLTVTGDITCAGTTTVVNSTNLHVKDPLILLNSGNVTIGNDIGLIFQRSDDSGTSGTENRASKGFIWDESADVFAFIACNAESGTTAGNVTISSYAPIVAAGISGTVGTVTAWSASLGLYAPQIGVNGDDDLMALSSGLVTVNGAVSASGFYAAQIGVNGDDDLIGLAANTASINGDLAIAGGGRIMLADNDDDSLIIGEGTNDYITFKTTNSSEGVHFHKELYMKESNLTFAHGQQITFWGENESAASGTISVSGSSHIVISGSQNKGVIVTGSVSSSVGFYAPQIGVSGDDDLLGLASGVLTLNGIMSASSLYVSSGGQIGVAGDDDLLVLKPGHFHCSGNFFATAVSGTSIDASTLAVSSELHVDSGSVKIVAPINTSGRTTALASLSGATWDGAFGVFISGSNMGDTTGHYNFCIGMSSSFYSTSVHTNMGMAFSPGAGATGNAKNTPYFRIFDAPSDNFGSAAGTNQYETTVLSASKGFLIYGRANDDGYHLELPNTASARAKSWATYSSAKYKKNIVEMDTADALSKVMTMRGVNYEWNVGTTYSPDVGFIAEEMAEVVPEVVKIDCDGEATSIDYSRLTSVIVEAMKEQQNQIEDLKQTIVQLQNGKQVKATVGKIKVPAKVKLKEKTSEAHQEIDAPEMFLDDDGVWRTKE